MTCKYTRLTKKWQAYDGRCHQDRLLVFHSDAEDKDNDRIRSDSLYLIGDLTMQITFSNLPRTFLATDIKFFFEGDSHVEEWYAQFFSIIFPSLDLQC